MSAATASGVDRNQVRQRTTKNSAGSSTKPWANQPEDDKKKAQDGSLISDMYKFEKVAAPILFTAAALFTRLYQIGKSSSVTWDEAHFGKFGSHYLKREYYFDVHPPLGKMLVGLSGYLAGYNGSFPFESGSEYPEELDYTTMRIFNAMFNVLCVPVAYYTAKNLRLSLPAVWLVSLMVLLEHSYVTLGKFILLDSMLLFFTLTSMLCLSGFHNTQRQPFSVKWWTWMFMTGLSIGCVTSVKMVGLFATAVVGVYTIADLWIKFGDTKMPIKTYIMHWIARISTLVVVPILVFALCFKIHFTILTHTGPGDSNMSSLFQANLIGNDIGGGPVDVAFGSRFTLKNQGLNGGLLHSHIQTFPEGSEQQQVTTYHHKDANNEWFVEHKRFDEFYSENEELHYLEDGEAIRLMHPSTGRNLHSHQIQAPLTKSKHEVSCYGNITIGDEKDNWIVEIVENPGQDNKSRIHPLSTTFRLKHQSLGCYLSGEGNNLPPWGFRQGEVTCNPKASYRDKKTWWNVENHWNDRINDTDLTRKLPKSSFLRDFVQLNFAMMASNNALVPDPDKQDDLASSAWEWPILHVGLRLCGWGEENVRYFLLGNPATTWLTTLGVVVFCAATFVYICRWQRQYVDFDWATLEHYAVAGLVPTMGWMFHYLPFNVMGRVTYVHHYMPSLYFAILTFAFLVDTATLKRNCAVKSLVYGALYALTIGVFILFAPISFGMTGELDQYKHLNWFSTWKIV